MSRFSALALVLILSVALVGCLGSGSSQTGNGSNGPTAASISVTPQNSALTVGNTLQFSAQATLSDGSSKDVSSTATWASSNPDVATVNSSGMVTAVKMGIVLIGVTSGQAKATTILNITSKKFSQSSLNGAYAFDLTSETNRPRFEAGSIKADGAGNFTGIEDINSASGVQKAVPVSGTYTVSADGRGSLTLNTTGASARTFHFVLSANSGAAADNDAQLIQFDKAGTAVGRLQKQNTSAFNNTSLANHTYVFRVGGLDSTRNPISRIGEFALDSTGSALSSGQQDENDNNTINGGAGATNSVAISAGSVGAVDSSTGRATVTLTVSGQAADFAAYIVSSNKMELVGVDAAPMLLGEAEAQVNPLPAAATAGGYTLITEIGGMRGQYWMTGEFVLNNVGTYTNITQYQDGSTSPFGELFPNSVVFSTGGRGTLTEITTMGTPAFTIYLVSGTRMYLQQNNDAHAALGVADLQQPGQDGFGTATLNNSYAFVASDTSDGNLTIVGQVVIDGTGHMTGVVDVSQPQPGNPSQISTSTVALGASLQGPGSIGLALGTVNTSGAGVQNFVLSVISSSKAQVLGLSPIDVNGTLVVQ